MPVFLGPSVIEEWTPRNELRTRTAEVRAESPFPLHTVLMRALAPFEEARAAVIAALRGPP